MQHIKAYMSKIDAILKDGGTTKKTKQQPTTGVSDKNIRIVAQIVKGIRDSREEMLNAK
jgi:hypothetical protein